MIRELQICSSKAVITEVWALFLFFKTFFTGEKNWETWVWIAIIWCCSSLLEIAVKSVTWRSRCFPVMSMHARNARSVLGCDKTPLWLPVMRPQTGNAYPLPVAHIQFPGGDSARVCQKGIKTLHRIDWYQLSMKTEKNINWVWRLSQSHWLSQS